MKILLLGDSFCVTKNGFEHHWVNLLKQYFTIENCASPGIGEYKIFKQYIGQEYDIALVHHTSPDRVHARYNPLHTGIRKNSDFMLNDVEYHYNNKAKYADIIYKYISNYVDFDYQREVWQVYVEKLKELDYSLHFTFFPNIPTSLIANNLYYIFDKNKNLDAHSHLNEKGHELAFKTIKNLIDNR